MDTTVLKIGNRAGKGGADLRPVTVKGKSAINAANRQGDLSSEKKYATGNVRFVFFFFWRTTFNTKNHTNSHNQAAKALGSDGQRLTKVDRSDEIIRPPGGDVSIGKIIAQRRESQGRYSELQKITRDDIVKKSRSGITTKIMAGIENGTLPPNPYLNDLEAILGIHLRPKNANFGEIKAAKGKKGPASK